MRPSAAEASASQSNAGPTGPGPPGPRFVDSLFLSSHRSEPQVFTHVAYPFKIVHVNQAWTQLCGYSKEEAQGLTCKILQGPRTSIDTLRALHASLDVQRPVKVRLVNYTKSGEMFVNELSVSPLYDDVGSCTHFVASLHACGTFPPSLSPRISSSAMAESAVAAALRATPRVQAPGNACVHKEEAETPQTLEDSSSRSECGSSILSRDSFPLHTLNNHPIAPVLLRMLQLNSSATRQPNTRSPLGSAEDTGEGFPSCSGMDGSLRSRYAGNLPTQQQNSKSSKDQDVFTNLVLRSGRNSGGMGGTESGTQASASTHSQLSTFVRQQLTDGGHASASVFMAAVVGQGVLAPGSWPRELPNLQKPPQLQQLAALQQPSLRQSSLLQQSLQQPSLQPPPQLLPPQLPHLPTQQPPPSTPTPTPQLCESSPRLLDENAGLGAAAIRRCDDESHINRRDLSSAHAVASSQEFENRAMSSKTSRKRACDSQAVVQHGQPPGRQVRTAKSCLRAGISSNNPEAPGGHLAHLADMRRGPSFSDLPQMQEFRASHAPQFCIFPPCRTGAGSDTDWHSG